MLQANMLEAKTDLSKLVRALETGEENVVLIAKNNVPVVKMVRLNPSDVVRRNQRIGVAKGVFEVPEEFNTWDAEVASLFQEQ